MGGLSFISMEVSLGKKAGTVIPKPFSTLNKQTNKQQTNKQPTASVLHRELESG